MKLTIIAAALAVMAAPAFAEKAPVKPTVTVEQCENEKLLLLIDILQADIARLQEDLKEVVGDQSEAQIRAVRQLEKFKKNYKN